MSQSGSVVEMTRRLFGDPSIYSKQAAYKRLSALSDACAVKAAHPPVLRLVQNAPQHPPKYKSEDFYASREWKQLRYRVLIKYGRKCMCCGSTDGAMHVDHIKPRSKYPHLALVFGNLQVLCEDCNMGKGAWDSTDFRPDAV